MKPARALSVHHTLTVPADLAHAVAEKFRGLKNQTLTALLLSWSKAAPQQVEIDGVRINLPQFVSLQLQALGPDVHIACSVQCVRIGWQASRLDLAFDVRPKPSVVTVQRYEDDFKE